MRLLCTLLIGVAIICGEVFLGMKTFFPEAQLNTQHDIVDEILEGKEPILSKISQSDLAWISTNPNVRIGTDPNFYPLETFDERGVYTGLASDYLKIISHLTGLNLIPVHGNSWAQAEMNAQEGEIDMFMAIVETARRNQYLDFTAHYIDLPGMIMTRRDDSNAKLTIKDLAGKKVIVVQDYYWHDFLVNSNLGIELILVPNTLTAMQRLAGGEGDALIDFEFNLLEKVQVGGFFQLENSGIVQTANGHSIAVRNELKELYNIVNIALSTITTSERELLMEKWLEGPSSLDTTKSLQWYFFFFTQAFLVCMGVIIWANSQVTNALRAKKEEASA